MGEEWIISSKIEWLWIRGPSSNCPATGDHQSSMSPSDVSTALTDHCVQIQTVFTLVLPLPSFCLSCHHVHCKILCVLLYTLQIPTAHQVVSFIPLIKSAKQENWLEERNLIITADKCTSYTLKKKKNVLLVTAIWLKLSSLFPPLTYAPSLERQTHQNKWSKQHFFWHYRITDMCQIIFYHLHDPFWMRNASVQTYSESLIEKPGHLKTLYGDTETIKNL